MKGALGQTGERQEGNGTGRGRGLPLTCPEKGSVLLSREGGQEAPTRTVLLSQAR